MVCNITSGDEADDDELASSSIDPSLLDATLGTDPLKDSLIVKRHGNPHSGFFNKVVGLNFLGLKSGGVNIFSEK